MELLSWLTWYNPFTKESHDSYISQINLIFVSGDPNKLDHCAKDIEGAFGNVCWYRPSYKQHVFRKNACYVGTLFVSNNETYHQLLSRLAWSLSHASNLVWCRSTTKVLDQWVLLHTCISNRSFSHQQIESISCHCKLVTNVMRLAINYLVSFDGYGNGWEQSPYLFY